MNVRMVFEPVIELRSLKCHDGSLVLCDEKSVQSAASLEEPESFIIIKVSFSARLGIIQHVISLTVDYASHPHGKKIQPEPSFLSSRIFLGAER